jgi:beta-phosphoglucomutase-like phosphatase (HAD superfamily)
MQPIEGVLFEPVGCLAEFPSQPFLEIAARISGRKQTSASASRSYWHLLNLMESTGACFTDALELQAVNEAAIYEDVIPALAELKTLGVKRVIASSLSEAAVRLFVGRLISTDFPADFDGIWNRDSSQGIKAAPLLRAVASASLDPARTIFLTETAEGLKTARAAGVHPILMMNDPDESRRLAQHSPSGGIVSLHELPDFIRLVRAENAHLDRGAS